MDKDDEHIVRSKTEARQGLSTGVIWVLVGSLTLAVIAAVVLGNYF
ncbi:hypothetical protein [Methyloceanibacter sp. wino2]|nr:hypothetical protein [Methyloceanibacter sp. wino2]